MVAIYKHKGFREYCGSYRGITLFVTLGKILAGILQKRVNEIAEHVLPETQCGFHASRAPAGRRGAVVKGVEHFSTIVLVNICSGAGSNPTGSVGRDFNLQKLNYQYLTTRVAVVLVVR